MDLQQYKTALTKEHDLLRTQLQSIGTLDPTVDGDWISTPEDTEQTEADENIVADRSEEWITRTGELSELETRFNNILRALEKLKTGIYGRCEICNEEIEADRLLANPAARTCKTHINDEVDLTL